MSKTAAIALALAVSLATPRIAEAGCGLGCPPWVDALAVVFGLGVAGGYAYGTGYYVVRDVSDQEPTLAYRGGELALHGTLGTVTAAFTISAADDGNLGGTILGGALTMVHGTLAVNGARGLWTERGEVDLSIGHVSKRDFFWPAAATYTANTLVWLAMAPDDTHGRNYGIAEAAVNGPLAIALGYVAIDRARGGDGGPALLYGGLAAVSGALALHGIRTALDPYEPAGIDLLGTDVMPTIVDDGAQQGMGLGAHGRW